MKKISTYLHLIVVLLISALVFGCSPIQVISNDFNPEAANRDYKTFNFYDVKVKTPNPESVKKERVDMLKNAVKENLEEVGLTLSDKPDVWVNIGVLVENKLQTRETDIREAPIYIGQRNYHWESEEVVVGEYKEGTVTIDLIDAKTNEMVGQSVASSVIVDNDVKLQKRIDVGMEKVFEDLWASAN